MNYHRSPKYPHALLDITFVDLLNTYKKYKLLTGNQGEQMINTLKFKESLEANGFNGTQASAISHAINETSMESSGLATKQALHEVHQELKAEIKDVREQIKDLREEQRDFKKCIERKMDQFHESIFDKVMNRTLICQIAIAAILVSIMIFFHQKP